MKAASVSTTRGAEAVRKQTKAREQREIARDYSKMGLDAEFELSQAEDLEAEAQELLRPAGEVVRGWGEAIDDDPSTTPVDQFGLIETLAHPDSVGLDASKARLKLIEDAGVLEPALDAANSIQASNSLEKMLAHQMPVAHRFVFKLLARASNPTVPPLEMARLTNAAARMMEAFQGGLLTLHKIRTGGKQTVVVQHVQVSGRGQAVIAGSVEQGGRGPKPGEGGENEGNTP
jgi:hypothetical protein